MPPLFDSDLRALRRDRAARQGAELFVLERVFSDCLERIESVRRRFEHALLLGCPDPGWPVRLRQFADIVDVHDPGPMFAAQADGKTMLEELALPTQSFDLVLSIGILDTVNDLSSAFRSIRQAMRTDGLFIGALPGGDTLPQLRNAMRAADALSRAAAPHVHPRIEASALAPLLSHSGFVMPVVDVDRTLVAYRKFDRLIADLRAMAATNLLIERPRYFGKGQRAVATSAFARAGDGERTTETFEILHFAAWKPPHG